MKNSTWEFPTTIASLALLRGAKWYITRRGGMRTPTFLDDDDGSRRDLRLTDFFSLCKRCCSLSSPKMDLGGLGLTRKGRYPCFYGMQ